MVFNWFRRQFNDKDASTPEEEPVVTPTEVEAEAPIASEEDKAAEYLKWAKSAYQNIQQQQAQATQESVVEDVVSEQVTAEITEIESLVDELEPETPVAAQADEPDAEPETPVAAQADEPDAEPSTTELEEQVEDAETVLASSEAPNNNLETQGATPLPFWAQTEADRLARIERLKATAIEEVEQEVPQPT